MMGDVVACRLRTALWSLMRQNPYYASKYFIILLLILQAIVLAEPVIIIGAQVPPLLGKPIATLRMCNDSGRPIPFQIDERTPEGEYVCDKGTGANTDSGNGCLDSSDEIVFLREDCAPGGAAAGDAVAGGPGRKTMYPIIVGAGNGVCRAYITGDTSLHLSPVRYITYDHASQELKTPAYFARFGRDRFHFIRAGIRDGSSGKWLDLTRELRVEIFLRALWGLVPIHYTEENLVCFVKRYKVGPVRLIRRGDFHLNLGLGLRGSRAAVNQICYPYMVSVPVRVHLPVRFKYFFKEAWLEMSPVIDAAGKMFTFSIPGSACRFAERAGGNGRIDSLIGCPPDRTPFFLLDGNGRGFGWMLSTDMPGTTENGSGFIFRRPSSRNGCADCGYKLMIRDVPRGRYIITNWVCFSRESQADIVNSLNALKNPVVVGTPSGAAPNRIVDR